MPVFVNADELRTFAAQLKKFSETLSESMARTQGQMGHLSESWRDEEFAQFRDVFARTYPLMREFIAEAEKAVPSLLRDAEAIEEYAHFKAE
jgi:uncharacterized protein YukE